MKEEEGLQQLYRQDGRLSHDGLKVDMHICQLLTTLLTEGVAQGYSVRELSHVIINALAITESTFVTSTQPQEEN